MFSLKDFFRRLTGSASGRASQGAAALDPAELSADWLIVGLGNPGPKYAATRHNVGYMAADDLLAADGDVLAPVRGVPAEVAVLTVEGQRVVVARSTTFMNLSGQAVEPLAGALGLPPEKVIAIHDELDLPAGKVRVKLGGNENGHNGLKSMTEHLDTRDYLRVRIGISRPPKGVRVPDHVLGTVDGGEDFDAAIATAAEAARLIVTAGLSVAQNKIHSR